jgi:Raf kinase inhibitor-like YbhB/YbcL family protein
VTVAVLAAGFALSSPVLVNGHAIPARYTCSGSGISPPLRWTAPPAGTRSLSLRMVDLDTHPQFRHWTLTGIPARTRSLAAGTTAGHAAQNTFGQAGYGGPCPPPGQKHRYLFTLDALGPGGIKLAETRLLVTFER